MELRRARTDELNKIIDLMISSGEWDEWKLGYLKEDWLSAMNTFRTIITNPNLGGYFIFEDKSEILGAFSVARAGLNSLFFNCAGIKEENAEEIENAIDRELFYNIPEEFNFIINFARPNSSETIPQILKNEGIKNVKEMHQFKEQIPDFLRKSITISSPFWYMERRIGGDVNNVVRNKIVVNEQDLECLKEHLKTEFLDSINIQNRGYIEGLLTKYNLSAATHIINKPEGKSLSIAYPHGWTVSGYSSSSFIFSDNPSEIIKDIEKNVPIFTGRRLIFVEEKMKEKYEKLGFRAIKPLHQIIYNIRENKKWRCKFS